LSGQSETELRILALRVAIECEGPKAVTGEVLDAAELVYAFLKGEGPDDAAAEPERRGARGRPH